MKFVARCHNCRGSGRWWGGNGHCPTCRGSGKTVMEHHPTSFEARFVSPAKKDDPLGPLEEPEHKRKTKRPKEEAPDDRSTASRS